MLSASVMQRIAAVPPLLLALACVDADQSTGPEVVPAPALPVANVTTPGFAWSSLSIAAPDPEVV